MGNMSIWNGSSTSLPFRVRSAEIYLTISDPKQAQYSSSSVILIG